MKVKENLYCNEFFYLKVIKKCWCDIKNEKIIIIKNVLMLIFFLRSENNGRRRENEFQTANISRLTISLTLIASV